MAKKEVEKAIYELNRWLPEYTQRQREEIVYVVGNMLASLPGGDALIDYGFTPIDSIGWGELELIINVLRSVESPRDVEYAAELLLADSD